LSALVVFPHHFISVLVVVFSCVDIEINANLTALKSLTCSCLLVREFLFTH